ncbi:toll-like receptor Toll5-like, partial [Homarus americanus]
MDPHVTFPEFYLGGNPVECDCTMEWLQTINSLEETRQHPTVIDLTASTVDSMNNNAVIPCWRHRNCSSSMGQALYRSEYEGDTDKAFDAFVSYSSKDEVFVTQILAPERARQPAYKLCLHYRDSSRRRLHHRHHPQRCGDQQAHHINIIRKPYQIRMVSLRVPLSDHKYSRTGGGDLLSSCWAMSPRETWTRTSDSTLRQTRTSSGGDTHFWEKLKFAMPDAQPPTRNHQLHALAAQQQPGPRPVLHM